MLRNFCRVAVSRSSGVRTSVKTPVSQCQLIPQRLMSDQGKDISKEEHSNLLNRHTPTNFQKRLLVWNQKYPSVAEVPEHVSASEIKNSYDWFRIRTSIGMMIAGSIGFLVMAIIAKKERDAGESLQKQNLRWHEEYNKKH